MAHIRFIDRDVAYIGNLSLYVTSYNTTTLLLYRYGHFRQIFCLTGRIEQQYTLLVRSRHTGYMATMVMSEEYYIKATRLTRYTHNIILLIIRSAYATLKS